MADLKQLRGWKEIAEHLAVSARTAKRWEHTHGLPVHRVRGSARDTVFAVPEELDQWRDATDLDQPSPSAVSAPLIEPQLPAVGPVTHHGRTRRRRVTYALAAMLVAMSAIAAYVWRHALSPIPAPTIVLRLSTTDGWTAQVSLRDGQEGTVTVAGRTAMTLRPHVQGEGLLLEVGPPAGLGVQPLPSGVHLERSVPVRVLAPIPFDVEWVAMHPRPLR